MAQTTNHATLHRLVALCAEFLRPPAQAYYDDVADQVVVTFSPALTPGEQTTLDNLRRLAGAALTISPAERAAIEDEIDGLRTYFGLATPTNAQSVAALKAIIVILRAVLRD